MCSVGKYESQSAIDSEMELKWIFWYDKAILDGNGLISVEIDIFRSDFGQISQKISLEITTFGSKGLSLTKN